MKIIDTIKNISPAARIKICLALMIIFGGFVVYSIIYRICYGPFVNDIGMGILFFSSVIVIYLSFFEYVITHTRYFTHHLPYYYIGQNEINVKTYLYKCVKIVLMNLVGTKVDIENIKGCITDTIRHNLNYNKFIKIDVRIKKYPGTKYELIYRVSYDNPAHKYIKPVADVQSIMFDYTYDSCPYQGIPINQYTCYCYLTNNPTACPKNYKSCPNYPQTIQEDC